MPGTTTSAQDYDNDAYRDQNTTSSSGSSDGSRVKGALRGAGAGMQAGTSMLNRSAEDASSRVAPVTFGYARGGKVRKTGPAIVHRGERVIPRGKVKRVERLMKRNKMRMKSSGR